MLPQSRASRVASGAMMSTVRAPAMVRAKTSRPRSSVPNQCDGLGACSEFRASWAVELWVMDVEKSGHEHPEQHDDEADHEGGAAQQRPDEVAPLALLLGGRCRVGLEPLLLPGAGAGQLGFPAGRGGVGAELDHLGVGAELHGLLAEVGLGAERGVAFVVHVSRPSGSAG